MALLLLLMHLRPCLCQAGIVALVTMASLRLMRDGIVALVTMALLPSSSLHHCPRCNDVVVIIKTQVPLPSLQWHCCPHCNSIVAVDAQASLPLLQW
jgi:hypothetical protein